jgi:hypothetical protein
LQVELRFKEEARDLKSQALGWGVGFEFPSKLFDRAQTDAIGFSESTIDGTCFGDAHFSTSNER